MTEFVEIVDRDDQVVGAVSRAQMRAERLRHRAVFIAVVHPDGRVLVHCRSDTKDLWPGWWDIAVGGVVSSGESYDQAARRELAEEVGIDAEPEMLGWGGPYDDDDVSVIGRCFRVVHPGPFQFTDGEIVDAAWMSVADLSALDDDPRQFVPDSMALMLPLLGALES